MCCFCVFVCCATIHCQGSVHNPCSFRRYIPVNRAEEQLAKLVVGNDSGMCKAGFPGDDAAGAVHSDARDDGRYGPEERTKSGTTQSTTNSGLKSIPFC